MDINSRIKVIEDFDCFLRKKKEILKNVISILEWDEAVLQDETKVACNKNLDHWVPGSRLSQHDETCSWAKDNYSKDEKDKQPPSSQFFYEKSSAVISVVLDKEMQANVLSQSGLIDAGKKIPDIPKTVDRWTVQFNPEQRLALYDYVTQEVKSSDKPSHVTIEDLMFDFEKKDQDSNKPKTRLEIMAELRDYKRRRQSYRAKNVHITKKSYTEVMKEVIENQITFLAETRKQENETDCLELEKTEYYEDPKSYKKNSEEKISTRETKKSESNHRSRHQRCDSRSPKRKKRERSRSKSRHKHKKSHHKHKKSRHYHSDSSP